MFKSLGAFWGVVVYATVALGQCHHGGSAAGRVTPLPAYTNSATFRPLGPGYSSYLSPTGTMMPVSVAGVVARQQYLLAQQQYLLHQQQAALAARPSSPQQTETETSTAAPSARSRRDQRRLKNAEKLSEAAEQAESKGNRASAHTLYRKIVRLVGADSELGGRAQAKLPQ